MKTDNVSNQLRWVILLLAAAVVLPTVCLLWFMQQAVKNERLAVEQKLINLYTDKIEGANKKLTSYWSIEFAEMESMLNLENEVEVVQKLFSKKIPAIVYNQDQEKIYPLFEKDIQTPDLPEQFSPGWDHEFIQGDYKKAIADYQQLVDCNDLYQQLYAKSAIARCYHKLNRKTEAIAIYTEIANEPEIITCDNACLLLISNARLYLARNYFLENPSPQQLSPEIIKAVDLLSYQNDMGSRLSIEQLYFVAQTVSKNISFKEFNSTETIVSLSQTLSYCRSILSGLIYYPSSDSLSSFPEKQLSQIATEDKNYYISKIQSNDLSALFIFQDTWPMNLGRVGSLKYYRLALQKTDLDFRIVDSAGTYMTGTQNTSSPAFLKMPISSYFPDWKIELYPKDTDLFRHSARQRITIYLWTGVLVAISILAAGIISIRAVNQQIKINRLKNDFIATVTHELKTPLASMRLLVDTLLEGNYEGEQTATEYLQLVANENKRLTHLIDSFLTFSRMERNKQVFDFAPVSPVEIAKMAIESIRPKFDNSNVQFNFDIRKPLPMIYVDNDGIVTVLVNLLDNAYKYTNSDKQIELMIYEQNGFVCFGVKDNGIGLSLRAQRKIFNRFYQVDSRLSRRAEGCGLGLSIVKFIVDAHKGKIEVQSQQGQGSTFTVKLPIVGSKNGNSINR